MRVRLVHSNDIDQLLLLAKAAAPGMTTFPPERNTLLAKIAHSEQQQRALDNGLRPEYLLFVLEDTENKTLVGTSAIIGELGKDDSFYSYKREKVTQRCSKLGAVFSHDILHLSHHFEGYAEVASLFLLPQYRQQYNGKLLAKVRYLFMGLHANNFPKRVMADLRGYVNEAEESPFWNAIGQHFFPMSYADADLFGAINGNQFIADLMPKLPIYIKMLPIDAQKAIGMPHSDGKPALSMLYKEGFTFTDYIDIFDGAPSVEAKIDELTTIQGMQYLHVGELSRQTENKTLPLLVSTIQAPFYCMVVEGQVDHNQVKLSAESMRNLNISSGEKLAISSLLSYKFLTGHC